MKPDSAPRRRLRIERLELDLRGIAPATAEAAARALGPALAEALAGALSPHHAHIAPAERIDAGRIASTASRGAHDLATSIARRIAGAARRRQS